MTRFTLIENALLVCADHYVPNGAVLIESGVIAACGPEGTFAVPEGAERIDANGRYLGPGLIDIHIHAGGPYAFDSEPEQAAAHVLRHGVTSVLATLYYQLNQADFLRAIDRVITAMDSGRAPAIKGFYMEGPYMNPAYGAYAEKNAWKGPIAREDYLPLLARAGARARVWAVAPEREGISGFVEDAKRYAPDAIFAVGHSEAAAEQVEALMPLGLRLATHHTNAIGNPPRYGGCHRAGVEEAVYANDDIYAELIADSMGIHVSPYMLRLISQRLKRRDRLILISDATAFRAEGKVTDAAQDLSFDDNGDLAGSRLTLDRACANMMRHTGASVLDAFRFASANPARLLGLHDLGALMPGYRADLIAVDDAFRVEKVLLGGRLISMT